MSRAPGMSSLLIDSRYDYKLRTEPEADMHDRKMRWPRARLLGGCSSMNAQYVLPSFSLSQATYHSLDQS